MTFFSDNFFHEKKPKCGPLCLATTVVVHKKVVRLSFLGNFLPKSFEIPKPQVASYELLESGNPWGGGEFAVIENNNVLCYCLTKYGVYIHIFVHFFNFIS